ncbi:basic salivary proline-rich protein 4-like [Chiroxiphia lanceolata]|uniref:basic salivary proline-rich protein 4-like n=1 Tax=Chiroxiphia lanceolata TaxID=296741 RepID=UPI0013CF01C7|nr:basic salivary proline-rich protein 4-like [Chiroxiphia lanceolata]
METPRSLRTPRRPQRPHRDPRGPVHTKETPRDPTETPGALCTPRRPPGTPRRPPGPCAHQGDPQGPHGDPRGSAHTKETPQGPHVAHGELKDLMCPTYPQHLRKTPGVSVHPKEPSRTACTPGTPLMCGEGEPRPPQPPFPPVSPHTWPGARVRARPRGRGRSLSSPRCGSFHPRIDASAPAAAAAPALHPSPPPPPPRSPAPGSARRGYRWANTDPGGTPRVRPQVPEPGTEPVPARGGCGPSPGVPDLAVPARPRTPV